MKPTAKTLIEKLGFQDPDRKSNKHDEIQLWTYHHIDEVLKSFSSPGNTMEITSRRLEYPIKQTTGNWSSVVGYVDLLVSGKITNQEGSKDFTAAIEIKSEIPCLGDLVRQINFYRQYDLFMSTTWIVISPDDRYQKVLKEQAIYFFKYKAPGELF